MEQFRQSFFWGLIKPVISVGSKNEGPYVVMKVLKFRFSCNAGGAVVQKIIYHLIEYSKLNSKFIQFSCRPSRITTPAGQGSRQTEELSTFQSYNMVISFFEEDPLDWVSLGAFLLEPWPPPRGQIHSRIHLCWSWQRSGRRWSNKDLRPAMSH